ncbi:nitrate- and nitrite sensing domain-containing protein [Actinomadura sp. NBRC 104425]|uniref:sensor histidine kinase n=1 Tax=Actinomadura sp. NBRC 104425 TaxID=3032204 RepID=UPI0025564CDE|nr:nitrate- and nitrite sensing domain-containing protein [Actinomadura sp. NBRC 104425]
MVPLTSLVALWVFAANLTLGPAFDKYDFSTTYEKIVKPGLYLVNQLQQERSLSVVAMTGRDAQSRQRLGVQRARVDAVQRVFRGSALSRDATDAAKPETEQRLAEALRWLDRLPQYRGRVDAGDATVLQVIDDYSAVLDKVIQVFGNLVLVNDLAIFEQGRALIGIGNARAYMLRQDALITAARLRDGRLTAAEHLAFVQWAAAGRREFDAGLADLDGAVRAPLQQLAESPEYRRYRAAETAVVNSSGGRLPAEAASLQAATGQLSQVWEQRLTQSSAALNDLAEPIGDRIVRRLVLAGGFGLLAVVASIVLSLLAARGLSRELRGLQRAALDLATDRLPGVVARLRRGEEVDVEAEAPPLVIGKTREVSRVGEAFTKVQHTAIDTAVREAYLRQGISRVFLNVAWRSQSLLHRQLHMLDEMERRTSDPEVLADLFRLDHLTTRMRRHAEGLVILSGATPARGWSRPVHIEDALHAAVAEVEDYTRVEVVVVSSGAALIGEVVADVVHLLAELIENATVFSPAPTEVLVRGEMGANGFAVDVIDRGIGLDQSELDALNLRLAQPPEFDLAVTDRLGLFVVGRLAGRHGIRVALQPSLYGGVSAVVLIPRKLIVNVEQSEDEAVAAGPRPAPQRPPRSARPDGADVPTAAWSPSTPPSKAMLNAPPAVDTWGSGTEPPSDRPPSFEGAVAFDASHTDRAAAPPPPRQEDPGTSNGTGASGRGRAPLPRRVRQANLAPQLRDDDAPLAAPAPQGEDPLEAWERRSAEASRELFASLQAGWLRGREEDEGPGDHRQERGTSP